MNCPNCNSLNADGKKYCADCGTPLDPQMQHIETLVKTKVEEFVKEKFKDQKAVQTETSSAVIDEVERRVKQFLFFAGIPSGLLLLLLAVSGIEKYRDFVGMVETAQNQVKQRLDQVKGDIDQAQVKATSAKANVEEALKTTDTVTAQVKALSSRTSELEKQTSGQMQASTRRIEAEVKELHQQMEVASKDLADQQKKLASTDELVKALFSKGTTEWFQTTANAPNVVIAPLTKGALVFMLLKSVPIYQTIEVKWRVFSQPHGSYWLTNNVLIFNWGDPADSLKAVPDGSYLRARPDFKD
jgi:DNA repair exonuclease SbcCD ATPase subunit